jgi:hypothetical protein
MDLITFRCSSCHQGLKVPADKAGRRVRCTKCGTALTVPATSQADGPGAKAAAPPPAPAKRPWDEEDEDDGGVYGVEGYTPQEETAKPAAEKEEEQRSRRRRRREEEDEDEDDEELDEEEIAARDEELRRRLMGLDEEDEDDDRPRRRRGKRRRGGPPRAKLDPAAWQKVRLGIIFVVIAVGLWGLALLLHEVYVLIGLTAGPQYAKALWYAHPHYEQDDPEGKVNLFRLAVALVGGAGALNVNLVLERISQIILVAQSVVLIVGCAICLAVTPRFGTRGLALTTLVVAGVNVLLGVVFRILPALGVMPFVLMPLLGPEVAMTDANIDRMVPLQLGWTTVPYVHVLLTVFIVIATYAELVLFPLFLRAVAQSLRSLMLEHRSVALEENALSLTKLALSQVFMQVSYQLLAMTGTSDVLGWVLRVVYCIGLAFFVGQLAWYAVLLLRIRAFIEDALEEDAKES